MYLYSFSACTQNFTLSLHISISNDHSSLECKAKGVCEQSLLSVHILQRKLQEEREKNESEMFFNSMDCGIWLSKECWQRKYSISS